MSMNLIHAQDCIETGEFDDPPCDSCAPDGWDPINAAEIDNVGNLFWCPTLTESPSGGTMVTLNIISGATSTEGIETTFDGLTAGVEYSLSFWWMSCELGWTSDAELIVDVGGEIFSFPNAPDWEIATLCFVAEEESVDVVVTAESAGTQSEVFIDDIDCAEIQPCCPLRVTVQEEYFVCPGEDLLIDILVENPTGSVEYEWTSDPSSGEDFLNALDVEDPIFNFSTSEFPFDGESFELSVLVTDEDCAALRRTIVNVYPLEEVTFDFPEWSFCETDGTFTFPNVSNEGVSGDWEFNSVDLEEQNGVNFTNTFTPDDGELECPIPQEFVLDISTLSTPDFDLPTVLCNSQDVIIELADESDNNIEGFWEMDLEFINPSEYLQGDYSIIFTPFDPFCTETYEWIFEVEDADPIRFTLQDSLCISQDTLWLPESTNNNIEGVWTLPFIIYEGLDSVTVSFIPEGDDCYENFEHTFHFVNEQVAAFELPDTLCRDFGLVTLDPLSPDGTLGSWNTSSFLTDTLSTDSIALNWSPIDITDACAQDYETTIYLTEPQLPEIDIPLEICQLEDLLVLDAIPLNNIQGEWLIDSFSLDTIMSDFITVEFIPNGDQCALNYTMTINILEPMQLDFDLPTSLCALDDPLVFPTSSLNGSTGSWMDLEWDPQQLGPGIYTNSFIPNDNCIETYNYTLEISELIAVTFDLPEFFCINDDVFQLPAISTNGIDGSWELTNIDPSGLTGVYNVIFMPDDPNCVEAYNYSFEVVDIESIDFSIINESNCGASDASLTIVNNVLELLYSIDQGMNWQQDVVFDQLGSGAYELWVTHQDFGECIETYPFEIEAPLQPQIEDVIISDNLACFGAQGRIELVSSDNDLEFSIDMGATWQTSPVFENLSGGPYIIMIRFANQPACMSQISATVGEFEEPMITSIFALDVDNCEDDNGVIEITATGTDLLYSIDGGQNFQASSLFENLAAGSYEIQVISEINENCAAELMSEIVGPSAPQIENFNLTQPIDCEANYGEIFLVPVNINFEYSIDGGQTWQSSNVFSGLEEGLYFATIRSVNQTDCIGDVVEIVLENQEDFFDQNFTIEVEPDSCMTLGGFRVFFEESNLQYSIDQVNWTFFGIFDDLSAGMYTLYVRRGIDPPCERILDEVEVPAVECSCPELSYAVNIEDIFCSTANVGSIEIVDIGGFQMQINSIDWSNNQSGVQIDNLSDGIFQVDINFDNDCMQSDTFVVERIDPISYLLETFDSDCDESENGELNISNVEGGMGEYNYTINGVDFQSSGNFVNLSQGAYEAIVTDEAGCATAEFFEILSGNDINIGLPSALSIGEGETVFLNPLINQSSIDSFSWLPSTNILNPGELIAEVSPSQTTEYTLTIYYGDCSEARSIVIEVDIEVEIYLANILVVDDFENSIIYPQGRNLDILSLESFKIYDRWGNLVFINDDLQLNDPNEGWDGRFNEQAVNPGVFVYQLEYNLEGKTQYLHGSITVLR